jgi:hypothetical protein
MGPGSGNGGCRSEKQVDTPLLKNRVPGDCVDIIEDNNSFFAQGHQSHQRHQRHFKKRRVPGIITIIIKYLYTQ